MTTKYKTSIGLLNYNTIKLIDNPKYKPHFALVKCLKDAIGASKALSKHLSETDGSKDLTDFRYNMKDEMNRIINIVISENQTESDEIRDKYGDILRKIIEDRGGINVTKETIDTFTFEIPSDFPLEEDLSTDIYLAMQTEVGIDCRTDAV
jgi:hypothetical protein